MIPIGVRRWGPALAPALVLTGGLLAAGAAAVDVWAFWPALPGSPRRVEVTIPPGASTAGIAARLAEAGVIRSPAAFRYLVRLRGSDGRLQAGTYLLGPGMSPPAIAAKLERGEVITVAFTVPEGLSAEEIARRLAARGLASEEELLAAFRDRGPVADLVPPELPVRYPLEGYLFPDTYRVAAGTPAAALAAAMVDRFRQVWTPALAARARELGLTPHQVVTLASIVEEEAQRPEERPVIAAVFHNRLRLGMPLQADPTVQYALRKYGQRVLLADLEADSPYNTYRHGGLPPGPIASPGAAAILAVLHPAEVPYLYFVARPDGSHAFSVTLAEHRRNVARYARP